MKADGTETLKIAYTYDINDQVTLMEDYEKKNGSWKLYRSTKYTYDALKRMSSYTEWDGEGVAPAEPAVSYSYDTSGNVTAAEYTDTGSELEGLIFEYDSSRRLTKIKADTGGFFKDTVREYEYDAQGRVSVIKDHYDFTGGREYLEKSYTYDDFGIVTSMAYRGGSGHNDIREAYVYTYDRNNNIKSERIVSDYDKDDSGTGIDITRVYTYDTAGRLTETRETDNSDGTAGTGITLYTYDKAGNRLTETKSGSTTSYSYNDLDQLTECRTAGEAKTYSYDRNGNQTSEITKEGSTEKERRILVYDEADRLKTLAVKEDDQLILTQENRYNGSGQRISKAETKLAEGLNGETTETTKRNYYYQDGAVLYTKDADGRRSSMNLLGTSANVIATSRGTGNSENWYLYNKDIRESTTSIIGENGSAAATYKYDDFGNTKLTGGTGIDNEICYTGQIYDQSSGLYYYNARFYDPENARFLTQDTYRGELEEPETLNLYVYCDNDPINYTDPSGHAKYDGAAAAAYALEWGMGRNPKYKDFGKDADCTNFVSQCIIAGGKAQVKPKHPEYRLNKRKKKYWYMVKKKTDGEYKWHWSNSWANVKVFYKHWRKKSKVKKCRTKKKLATIIKKGDIVQLKKKGEGWTHSIIISCKKDGTWRYAGHSRNHKWYKISKIGKEYKKFRRIRPK